jgi:hypothetical protein
MAHLVQTEYGDSIKANSPKAGMSFMGDPVVLYAQEWSEYQQTLACQGVFLMITPF